MSDCQLLLRVNIRSTLFVLLVLCLAGYATAMANTLPTSTPVPGELTPGLKHLIELVGPRPRPDFDPRKIDPLIEFLSTEKPADNFFSAPRETGRLSAYYRNILRRSLRGVIGYAFSPDIPLVATATSSTRIVRWVSGADGGSALPQLSEKLGQLESPVVIHGREYVVNTPDRFSGAYYDYEQERTLILYRYQQRYALISISRQADLSGPGRKGLVLGNDDNWDYLYSSQIGLNIKGLGWMRSHMFDSYGINIYIEAAAGSRKTILGAFKWVRAGWNKINVVRDGHVYSGLQRFGSTLKKILESPFLPKPAELASILSPIESLSHGQLRKKMGIYRSLLAERHENVLTSRSGWPSKIFSDPQYWNSLKDEEMKSVLVVEKMKHALGGGNGGRSARLLDFNH